MTSPLVITVILNTNRREDTLAVLDSLSKGDYPNHQIMVLDNASSDGSVQAIRERFASVQIIPILENRGYAGNNNVGIEAALAQGAEWVFVLNEDTILASDCIRKLVEAGASMPEVGIVGPMVYHHSEPTVIQSAGGVINSKWQTWHAGQNEVDHGQFPEIRQVDWLSGCAIMVRRGVIEQVGMLDVRFFYYFEETEWCLRSRNAGWKILHVPQAHLWHKGVQKNYTPGANVTYYATRNRFLLFSKHKAPIIAWLIAIWETARTLFSWSIRPKWRDMRDHRDAMWQGMMDFIGKRWGMRGALR